jgi:hypothetical protein
MIQYEIELTDFLRIKKYGVTIKSFTRETRARDPAASFINLLRTLSYSLWTVRSFTGIGSFCHVP